MHRHHNSKRCRGIALETFDPKLACGSVVVGGAYGTASKYVWESLMLFRCSERCEVYTCLHRHAGAHNHEDLWNFLLLLLKKSDGTKGPIITAVVIALLALDVPGLFDVTCPEDRKAANTIAKNISDVILKSHEKSENRVLMRLEEILVSLVCIAACVLFACIDV